jgi:hypothetical protein
VCHSNTQTDIRCDGKGIPPKGVTPSGETAQLLIHTVNFSSVVRTHTQAHPRSIRVYRVSSLDSRVSRLTLESRSIDRPPHLLLRRLLRHPQVSTLGAMPMPTVRPNFAQLFHRASSIHAGSCRHLALVTYISLSRPPPPVLSRALIQRCRPQARPFMSEFAKDTGLHTYFTHAHTHTAMTARQ